VTQLNFENVLEICANLIVYKLSFFKRSQGQFYMIFALLLAKFAQFRAAKAAAQIMEAV
jgi:hypothetical protein